MNNISLESAGVAAHAANALRTALDVKTAQLRIEPALTLITKTAGGVGADFLTSMLAAFFRGCGFDTAVLQVGGTKGPVATAHPAGLFARLSLGDADNGEQMADYIIEHVARPAIVMVDPAFNANASTILHSMAAMSCLPKLVHVHLFRSAAENFRIHEDLRDVARRSVRGTLESTFEAGTDNVWIIPKLSAAIVDDMLSHDLGFAAALARAPFGATVHMQKRMMAFVKDCADLYA